MTAAKKQTNTEASPSKVKKPVLDPNDPHVLLAKAALVTPFLIFSGVALVLHERQLGWVSFGAAAFIGAPGFLGNQIKSMAQGALKGLLAEEQEHEREQRNLPSGEKDESDSQ